MIDLSLKDEYEKYLPTNVQSVIEDISAVAQLNHYEIYLIGGAVRDLIIGKEIFDIDIVVEGDAVSFADKLLENFSCTIVQIQPDLRTVKIEFENGLVFDLASTRCESYIEPATLPVTDRIGCSLVEDVKRRDFTINSMAMVLSGENKFKLVDYLGGYEDVQDKKIRILHNQSFVDDPSRLIRGLKFAVRFGFDLDEQTLALQNNYINEFKKFDFPKERIRSEIQQLFSLNEPKAYDCFVKQNFGKLIGAVYDSNINGKKIFDAINLFKLDSEYIWLVYLACLLYQSSEKVIFSLNLTVFQQKMITDTIKMLNTSISLKNNYSVYKMFAGVHIVSLIVYYILTKDCSVFLYLNELKNIKPILTGKDLIELGFLPSKQFGQVLENLLSEKIEGNLPYKEDEIAFVLKYLK